MRRRLPDEPEHLIEQLSSWIAWRYADSNERLVLTSAPTSVPFKLNLWMPAAVWRLAWHGDGTAVLYGIAPGNGPTEYFIARNDDADSRREGVFDRLSERQWLHVEGDSLKSRRARSKMKAA